ncbi:MAG: methionine--tRNA ligase subunit beta [Candidatus Aenigmatarchaeota archaeon]
MITFQDFQKVEMKVGKIKSAKPIEGATKLLLLDVDIGAEVRKLVAGIADAYKPDELVGKSIVVVVNLEPKKLRGVESQGMLLAADAEKPVLLTVDKDVPPGTPVR